MTTKRVRRVTEITMETAELVFARRPRQRMAGWCAICAKEVPRLSLDEAAWEAGVDTGEVLLWVAERRLHLVRTSEGPAICGQALRKIAGADPEQTRGAEED